MSIEKCIDDCCFMCKHFYHADPDTDKCDIDGHEVYFDTLKCEKFLRYS